MTTNTNENEKSTRSQVRRLEFYLQAGHSISSLEALRLFGCMRLSARIKDLKSLGYSINAKSERNPVTGKRYARYELARVAA